MLRIKKRNGGTLSELVNDLLAEGLKRRRSDNAALEIEWFSLPIRARVDVDLEDKDDARAINSDDSV